MKGLKKGKRPGIEDFILPSGAPFVPEHLAEEAQRCMEVIKSSMPDGVYSEVDTYLLAAFAQAWHLHKFAAHTISDPDFEHVETLETAKGTTRRINPWITMCKEQAMLMASLGDRLGLHPKARANIGQEASSDRPLSKFDGLVGLNG